MNNNGPAIIAKDLVKSYGKTRVLNGVSFEVESGRMLALLGPNGAGKTTTVRILSTLLKDYGGTVTILGYDVASQADKVRTVIGLTGQSASIDELLTGRENLIMMGRLYRLTKASSVRRAGELLKDFDLETAADRPVKIYSGGMRRRLDLAVSLIAAPPVIFLDEPTTGLDPRSRLAMWDIIKSLKSSGTTILLTTQYLEEADQLADKIILIDGGKVIASGTATELKNKVGKDRLDLGFRNAADLNTARNIFGKALHITDNNARTGSLTIDDTSKDLKIILNKLSGANIAIEALSLHKPSLDDVFLTLTGKSADATKKDDDNE